MHNRDLVTTALLLLNVEFVSNIIHRCFVVSEYYILIIKIHSSLYYRYLLMGNKNRKYAVLF